MKPTTASKMRMSPRKKDVYLSPGYGGQQTEQAETCPRSGFAHSPTSDFLPKNSEYKAIVFAPVLHIYCWFIKLLFQLHSNLSTWYNIVLEP